MNRAELNKAIIYATEIVRQDEVYIIGSQSILGSFGEEELPADVTLSNEVDIAPVKDDPEETAATLLDGQIGELSDFHAENASTSKALANEQPTCRRGGRDGLFRCARPDIQNPSGCA